MSRERKSKRRSRSRPNVNARTGFRKRNRHQETVRVLGRGSIVGLVLITAVFIGSLAAAYWSNQSPIAEVPRFVEVELKERPAPAVEPKLSMQVSDTPPVSATFDHCEKIRHTCVVDGDTFWLNGEKVRIADIDTPEISQPQCAAEKQLGDRATNRLIELLNAGSFELRTIGSRDEDKYGRKLRVVVRDGQSLGNQLVNEGLARTWTGRREPWCMLP